MVEIKEIIRECEEIIESFGWNLPPIRYDLNGKKTTAIGTCKRRNGEYTIVLSKPYMTEFLKRNMKKRIETTVLHEMCHALPNGMNHGANWLYYVNQINRKYGYDIKRVSSVENEIAMNVRKDKIKYEVHCPQCGIVARRQRQSDLITNTNAYRCKCGNHLMVKEV